MKKFLIGTLISILFIICVGCAINTMKINSKYDKNMDKVITRYLIDRFYDPNDPNYGDSTKAFEVHHVFGTETKKNVTTFYINSAFGVFRQSIDAILSGYVVPAVIKIKKTNSSYEVIDYEEPRDGKLYVETVKKMFPKKYVNRVLSNGTREELNKKLLKQVHEWNGQK
ncbi:hypothetical protein [Gottfriedia luciferensis]|uniref:hypothetical protein n=1 Tax=Gottfriedia luciferensis TaxID=178774 RepID=UPI000B44E3F1|nr:hypothetical protein [Gottfriedia luciferensis]